MLGNPWLSTPIRSAPLNKNTVRMTASSWQCEAIKYFKHMVEGHLFVIFMDHKPLTYAFQQHRDKCLPREFHHLEFIGQFSTDFKHVLGQDNVVADALLKANSIMTPLDYHALASSQGQDAELQDILKNGLVFQVRTGAHFRDRRQPLL